MTVPEGSRAGFTFTTRGPGSMGPVRTFGPARSIATRGAGRPAPAHRRTAAIMAAHACSSSWAQFTRARSMPASAIRATSSGSVAASEGIVTMMRASRSPRAGPSRLAALRARMARPSAGVRASSSGAGAGSPSSARAAASTAST